MPDYLRLIGEHYYSPPVEAYVVTDGDPTDYNDIVWIDTPISQAALDALAASQDDTLESEIIARLSSITDGDVLRWDGNNFIPESALQIEKDDALVGEANVINFEGAVTVVDEGTKTTVSISGSGGTSGIGGWSEIVEFGDGGKGTKNKFLKSAYSNHTSLDSTAIALADGEVVHATISTEEDPTNNWFAQVIINAQKGVGGTYGGGTQIGTDLEKPTAVLDKVYTDLTGFAFSAGDRLQVYVLEGTLGEMAAVEPVVRLYVRYD